jgi:uncharacterized protein YjbJ (UPF0337 family)
MPEPPDRGFTGKILPIRIRCQCRPRLSMILSENRYPLFGIMRQTEPESLPSVRPHENFLKGVHVMDKDRWAGAAKDAAGKVEGAVGDLAGDAQTSAAGRAREAAGTVQNLYGQAKDAARSAGDAAVNLAKDAYDKPGETLRDGSEVVAKQVRDNPLGALLVAGGIGFALAMIMTRPPRRPPPRWRYYS